jgi:DNA mismatch repair ATPase MutS
MTASILAIYDGIKRQYPAHVVLMRLGDFLEAFGSDFGSDADTLAQVCDLVKTRRLGRTMAGVPYSSADRYIAQLIAADHKAVVIEFIGTEQTEETAAPGRPVAARGPATTAEDTPRPMQEPSQPCPAPAVARQLEMF